MAVQTRPAFDPTGLPVEVHSRALAKAAASFCYVSPEGGTFYISEAKAQRMFAAYGGAIFPPEAA